MNPIYLVNVSESIKEEWMTKEHGSYEDAGKPNVGHVYNVILNSPKGKIACYTEEEKALLLRSANYQTYWICDSSRIVKRLRSAAERILKATKNPKQ